jgi:hypothetical protein
MNQDQIKELMEKYISASFAIINTKKGKELIEIYKQVCAEFKNNAPVSYAVWAELIPSISEPLRSFWFPEGAPTQKDWFKL